MMNNGSASSGDIFEEIKEYVRAKYEGAPPFTFRDVFMSLTERFPPSAMSFPKINKVLSRLIDEGVYKCFFTDMGLQYFYHVNTHGLVGESIQTDRTVKQRKAPRVANRTMLTLVQMITTSLKESPKTREQLAKETTFAKQRICAALAVMKALGLIQERADQGRMLVWNFEQEEILQKAPQYIEEIHQCRMEIMENERKEREILGICIAVKEN